MTIVKIYEIGADQYWTGAKQAIGEMDGAPLGWTRTPIPELEAGEYAVWTGGGWLAVTDGPQPLPEQVPQEVSRRQGLQALYLMYGLKEQDIVQAIDADSSLSDSEKYLARVELLAAQTFVRDRPLVILMGQGLSLDLDRLFIVAGGLP